MYRRQVGIVIEPQFDSPASFYNNVAFVTKNGLIGIIDSSGQVVCDYQFEPATLYLFSNMIPF